MDWLGWSILTAAVGLLYVKAAMALGRRLRRARHAQTRPLPPTMRLACAWCGSHLRGDPAAQEVSHGICAACADEWEAEMERELARDLAESERDHAP